MPLKYLPILKNVSWTVGVSPWVGLRSECLVVNKTCDPGYEMEYLIIIAKLLGVKLNFVETNVAGCGSKQLDGSWTGLMGLLQSGKIDITGNMCSIKEDRLSENFSTITFPTIQDKQYFLIKVPESYYGFEIGGPFQLDLWYTLIGFWIFFFIAYTAIMKVFCEFSSVKALYFCFDQMITVLTGLDKRQQKITLFWFLWLSFVGFFLMLYSMYITGILFRPLIIERPFQNNEQLANKIYYGEYTLVDYRQVLSYPQCHDHYTCDMFRNGVAKHGFKFLNLGITEADVKQFFNQMLKSSKLVLVQTKQFMGYKLQNFAEAYKLWQIEDEQAGEIWYTYYMKSDFSYKRLLYEAIIATGDYKWSLFNRHWHSSLFVHKGKNVKRKASPTTTIGLKIMKGPFMCYSIGIIIALVLFVIERSRNKRRIAIANFNHFLQMKFRRNSQAEILIE